MRKLAIRSAIATAAAAGTLLTAGIAGAVGNPDPNAFICPVLGGEAGEHGNGQTPFVPIADGDYTVLGPDVRVPMHATNDDGAGTPGGAHASPGDGGYTAIWYTPTP